MRVKLWRVEDIACQLSVRITKICIMSFSFMPLDVISKVGPKGKNPEILQSAYKSCQEKMLELGLKTIVR